MTLSAVARQLGALVVDFLDVALGARRANDVGRIGDPLLQPVEALAAHAGRQHGHAAAAENARDRNAAAAVVAGRRPDRPVVRRIELPGHQARHQAGIGGEHLVRADHRKAPAEQDDDRRLHAGQRSGRTTWPGTATRALRLGIVEPVNAPEVGGLRRIGIHLGEIWRRLSSDVGWMSELAPSRQRDLHLAQARNCGAPASSVNDLGFNDEAHRAGLILLVRPRARDKASQSPAGK